MSCCNNIYDLGCFGACGIAILPFSADNSDIYTFKFDMNNFTYESKKEFLTGEAFQVDINSIGLNEMACIKFKIYNSDNELLIYEFNGIEYDCFKIKIK